MSFKCKRCKKPQKSKVKPIKVITGRRKKTYRDVEGAVIGEGWEILGEDDICPKCDEKAKKEAAPAQQPVVEQPAAPQPVVNTPPKFNRPNRYNGPRDGREKRNPQYRRTH